MVAENGEKSMVDLEKLFDAIQYAAKDVLKKRIIDHPKQQKVKEIMSQLNSETSVFPNRQISEIAFFQRKVCFLTDPTNTGELEAIVQPQKIFETEDDPCEIYDRVDCTVISHQEFLEITSKDKDQVFSKHDLIVEYSPSLSGMNLQRILQREASEEEKERHCSTRFVELKMEKLHFETETKKDILQDASRILPLAEETGFEASSESKIGLPAEHQIVSNHHFESKRGKWNVLDDRGVENERMSGGSRYSSKITLLLGSIKRNALPLSRNPRKVRKVRHIQEHRKIDDRSGMRLNFLLINLCFRIHSQQSLSVIITKFSSYTEI